MDIAFVHRWQLLAVLVLGVFVLGLNVQLAEAVELDDGTRGAHGVFLAVRGSRGDVDTGVIDDSV